MAVHENQQLVLKVMINTLFCGIVHNATSEAVFEKCSTVKNRKFLQSRSVLFKDFLQAFKKVKKLHLE